MTYEEVIKLANGTYALERKHFLEESSPCSYKRMLDDGSLWLHLAYTELNVTNYIKNRVDAIKRSAKFKETYAAGNISETNKMLHMEKIMAKNDANYEYICVPLDSEEEEEERLMEMMSEEDIERQKLYDEIAQLLANPFAFCDDEDDEDIT